MGRPRSRRVYVMGSVLAAVLTVGAGPAAPLGGHVARAAEPPRPSGGLVEVDRIASVSVPAVRPLATSASTAPPTTAPTASAGGSTGRAGEDLVGVVVELEVPALAERLASAETGAGASARRTTAAVIERRLDSFASLATSRIPGLRVVHRYRAALGGVALLVPRAALGRLGELDGVRELRADVLLQTQTDASVALIGARRAWRRGGASLGRGQGTLIGVLDEGIWPEHPCFADPDAFGEPYPAREHAHACELDDEVGGRFACNGKLVGARRLLAMHDAVFPPALGTGGARGARDERGHGTHVSAIAACNEGVEARVLGVGRGRISGVAPRASVIAYKVCGRGGCFASDVVAAVDQAILDGVDVINFSVSGGAEPYESSVELAFLDAYEAGVFVAASAGNDGPAQATVNHRGPWVTAVAATSSNRAFVSTLALRTAAGDGLVLDGGGLSVGVAAPVELVVPHDDRQCSAGLERVLPGSIVVCDRGSFARVTKGFNAAAAGATGMVLRNLVREGIAADSHHLPAIHLEFDAGRALADYLAAATAGGMPVSAQISAGTPRSVQADVVAPFSARGGTGLGGGVVKPDIAAPGVQILAAHAPAPASPASAGPAGELFQVLQGTSMASPHVAGAAALLRARHPEWGPGRIKSALLLTARTAGLTIGAGDAASTAHDRGAGRVDVARASVAGLSIAAPAGEYREHRSDAWNANHPSAHLPAMPGRMTVVRRLRGESERPRSWRLRVRLGGGGRDGVVGGPGSGPGAGPGAGPRARARVRPRRVTATLGQEVAVRIRVDASGLAPGASAELELIARSDGERLHMPLTLERAEPSVSLTKRCEPAAITVGEVASCTLVARNATSGPAVATITDAVRAGLRLLGDSVSGADVEGARVRARRALAPTGGLEIRVASGPWRFGYLPLSSFDSVEPLVGVLDDEVVVVDTPPIVFGGRSYTRVGFASNGLVVLGGAGATAAQAAASRLPDPRAPNAVVAPCWADLDPSSGGTMRAHTLATADGRWTVFDWEDVVVKHGGTVSCQAWFGHNGIEEIAFAYGAVSPVAARSLTIGAEDSTGAAGATLSASGPGALAHEGLLVRVSSRPTGDGTAHVIGYRVEGVTPGSSRGCARLRSDAFDGTALACAPLTVTPRATR